MGNSSPSCGHTYQTLSPLKAGFPLLESAPTSHCPAGLCVFLDQVVPSPSVTMPKNPWAPDESDYVIFVERAFIAGDLICGVGYGESLSLHA